jgi:hypothetical protein
MSLPDPDDLFDRFVAPHFPPGRLEGRMFPKTFPDVVSIRPGMTDEQICVLPEELRQRSEAAVNRMVEAARTDLAEFLGPSGDLDLDWVDAFDKRYDQSVVEKLIARSDPNDFSNDVLLTACEFGASLGYVLKGLRPELVWAYDYPYWDSWLYSREKGYMLPMFSWAFKKFSNYGIDDGFAGKLRAAANTIGKA